MRTLVTGAAGFIGSTLVDRLLAEGPFDADACTVECPRHGSLFDLTSGRPKTLPAYQPVTTYPVTIEDDTVKLEVA